MNAVQRDQGGEIVSGKYCRWRLLNRQYFAGCFITGGGALTPGLIDGLEAIMGVEVNIMNPFGVIDFDRKKFTEADMNNIVARGAVALGLAMRNVKK